MIFYLNKVKVWRSVAGLDLVIKGEKSRHCKQRKCQISTIFSGGITITKRSIKPFEGTTPFSFRGAQHLNLIRSLKWNSIQFVSFFLRVWKKLGTGHLLNGTLMVDASFWKHLDWQVGCKNRCSATILFQMRFILTVLGWWCVRHSVCRTASTFLQLVWHVSREYYVPMVLTWDYSV